MNWDQALKEQRGIAGKAGRHCRLTETKRRINKQAVLGESLVQAVMRCEGNKNNSGKYLNSTLYISDIVAPVL